MNEYQPALEQVSGRTFSRRQALMLGAGAAAGLAMNGRVRDWVQPDYDVSRGPEIRPNIDLDVRAINYSFNLLTGQNVFGNDAPLDVWSETPGVTMMSDGRLLVAPLDMKIINKRGYDEYVDNPPINVCGGYIRTNGDFAIETTISSEGPVHVQLYGKVPKLLDDNRYEHARLDCELADHRLRVRSWSGGVLDGEIPRDFRLPQAGKEHTLRVSKVGDRLQFMVDGYEVGSIGEGGLFDDGSIWLGLNSTESYATVSQMTYREIDQGRQYSGFWQAGQLRVNPSHGDTLQGLVDARGLPLMMGSAVSLYPLVTEPQYAQVMLGGNYKILTIENAMKELYLMSTGGIWEPKHALSLIRIIQDHGILVNGHTALYDKAMHKHLEQMPTETHADTMRVAKYIEDHIVRFGEEFGKYLYSCDVVNETVDGFGPEVLDKLRIKYLPRGVHLRQNVFARALGREWIALAFKTAAQVMPNTKLGMNEFGLEIDPWNRGEMVFDLADYVEGYGGRVDYIGSQTHIYHRSSFALRSVYRYLLALARQRGRTMRTSEMDVSAIKGEVAQMQQYIMILEENLRAGRGVDAHITWGSDDKYGSTGGRGPGSALPYDSDYREKLILREMKNTLRTFTPTK